jgi:DisA bacterial checkpoint controller nucleotide-binding
MLSEKDAIECVIDLVPNWYLADFGPVKLEIKLLSSTVTFFSHRTLTPELKALHGEIVSSLPILYGNVKDIAKPTAIEIIQEYFAIFWLNERNNKIQWKKLLEYSSVMSLRTYENQNVTCNFVISEGTGSVDITSKELQKVIDPLATSPFTFIRINHDLSFIDYEEIMWSEVADTEEYKLNPEFLQPIKSKLQKNEFSLCLTNRGDIVVINKSGLLAAKRKKKWKLYDALTFKNFIVDVVGSYRVGANLFEMLWDLSFKRHGALLVYDPNESVVTHVVNKGSVIHGSSNTLDMPRSMLVPSVRTIAMGQKEFPRRKKRLLLELASMDGALIFSEKHILAFGAMVETHKKADGEFGARSTAARSAFHWGGHPIKVSSDGEVTLYFTSKFAKNSCTASTDFL